MHQERPRSLFLCRKTEEKMNRPVQAVVSTEKGHDKIEHSHPAFALIGAARVSGGVNLFGSDFTHHTFVEITLKRAVMERHLSHDWPSERQQLAKVLLSEAQWATFVSSMNMGTGTPCTLDFALGEQVPLLPRPEDRSAVYAKEMRETQVDAIAKIQSLIDTINAAGLPEKKRKELVAKAELSIQELGPNTEYVAKQFGKHMEVVTERAKMEVSAYANQTLRGLGGSGAIPIQMQGTSDQAVIDA